jgi:hypothetical protein
VARFTAGFLAGALLATAALLGVALLDRDARWEQ